MSPESGVNITSASWLVSHWLQTMTLAQCRNLAIEIMHIILTEMKNAGWKK